MSLKQPIYAMAAMLGFVAAGCNSDPEQATVSTYESTAVEAFSLKANEKVLAHLDSVYFSIDLNNGQIFNADSLPKGTDVSRLAVNISTSAVGKVELVVNRGALGDTIYNYTASQNDSIDFSHGPVIMKVTAQNGTVRDYTVRVNVHRMQPDSLYWSRTAVTSLPTLLETVVAQKTVEFGHEAVTLTADASGNACMAVSANPADGWEMKRVILPAGADVRTLTATASALYMLDDAGNLHTASTPAGAWTLAGVSFVSLLGGYGDTLLAVGTDASGGMVLTGYPAGSVAESRMPDDFPVSGTSALISFGSKWSEHPTAVFAGGVTRSGHLSGDVWAFDGSSWARINPSSPLPPAEGITLVPYYSFTPNTDWSMTRRGVLMALGGRNGAGTVTRAVYVSWDRGITWRLAATTMRLPEYMPSFAAADALVFSSRMSLSRGNSVWDERPDSPLPRWWRRADVSRAVTPVTEWECPYVYLFGGENNGGVTHDTVWRGVVNRLTFVPLY